LRDLFVAMPSSQGYPCTFGQVVHPDQTLEPEPRTAP
jgi:hypothetical protein